MSTPPFPLHLQSAEPTVLVDVNGHVIRSPETEAEIAKLKARIAEREAENKSLREAGNVLLAIDDALPTSPTNATFTRAYLNGSDARTIMRGIIRGAE